MVRKTEAYVDTSALISLADRSDTHHPLFRRLFVDPPPLLTTTLVIAEGHGWFLKRYDSTRGLQSGAVGLHLMEERGVTLCWSTDFHLGLTGVPFVIHQE